MSKEPIPVKVGILRTIYRALMPIRYRLHAILQDFYKGMIILSQAELTAVLEFSSAASTAELMLSDYLEQAQESNAEELYLPSTEFHLLLDLSKTAELSSRAPIANSGLWLN